MTPNRVAVLRLERGLLPWELAEKAGICERTLQRIEQGLLVHGPQQATKKKIVLALGLPWERRDEVFPRRVR
jgi:DNA-binding XRE family transcriptional regulator